MYTDAVVVDSVRRAAWLKGRTARAYYTSKVGIHQDLEYKGNVLLPEFVGYEVKSGAVIRRMACSIARVAASSSDPSSMCRGSAIVTRTVPRFGQ